MQNLGLPHRSKNSRFVKRNQNVPVSCTVLQNWYTTKTVPLIFIQNLVLSQTLLSYLTTVTSCHNPIFVQNCSSAITDITIFAYIKFSQPDQKWILVWAHFVALNYSGPSIVTIIRRRQIDKLFAESYSKLKK